MTFLEGFVRSVIDGVIDRAPQGASDGVQARGTTSALAKAIRAKVPSIDDLTAFSVEPMKERNGSQATDKDGALVWGVTVVWEWRSTDGDAAAMLGQQYGSRRTVMAGPRPTVSGAVARVVEELTTKDGWTLED